MAGALESAGERCARAPEGAAVDRTALRTSSTSLLGAEKELMRSTMCWWPRLSASSTGVLSILRQGQRSEDRQAAWVLAVACRDELACLLVTAAAAGGAAVPTPEPPCLASQRPPARPTAAPGPASLVEGGGGGACLQQQASHLGNSTKMECAIGQCMQERDQCQVNDGVPRTASWPIRHAQCSAVLPLSLAADTFCTAAVKRGEDGSVAVVERKSTCPSSKPSSNARPAARCTQTPSQWPVR